MEKRSILLYWLLILIPAIIISIAAFRLLYHEQERIDRLAIAAIEDRTRAIGETLQVAVEAVEDELTQALLGIPQDNLKDTLLDWEEKNPLVRNVFIWDEDAGLTYPETGIAATEEERNFISRFDGLFSGRVTWPSKKPENDLQPKATGKLIQDIRSLNSGRSELLKLAQKSNITSDESAALTDTQSPGGGWIPWYSDNKLYILGYVNKNNGEPVYGIELELMTLLSRLINNFPQTQSENSSYALVDDTGRMLHHSGDIDIEDNAAPLLKVPLDPHLPHWTIAAYMPERSGILKDGNNFMLLAGLLLIIFLVAIVSGGFLLMRNARQNMIDAHQKTSFVSNVSHELKTPLTSIRMFAELLLEERVKDQEKKNKYLGIIVSESRRLTRLVNNVLDFSRLEQGKKKYNFEELDAGIFLKDLMEFHQPRIKDAGMYSILSIPDREILIKTDRDALEQVILNLVDNAIKYANEGKEISISLINDIDNLEIKVEDRGPGVPESHRKKIFEKFHRVDESLTTRIQGSGLGLSIAKRMLEDIGGNLSYTPGQAGGSCFTVKVPVN
ncbi:MAG: HAMP domain-containing histidine kinase [Deltaproteobacteria bacterium]|nr:HAMP domain-containing histidine kinase [Deltaproteobacteria bacterium]